MRRNKKQTFKGLHCRWHSAIRVWLTCPFREKSLPSNAVQTKTGSSNSLLSLNVFQKNICFQTVTLNLKFLHRLSCNYLKKNPLNIYSLIPVSQLRHNMHPNIDSCILKITYVFAYFVCLNQTLEMCLFSHSQNTDP